MFFNERATLNATPEEPRSALPRASRASRAKRVAVIAGVFLVVYLAVAYLIVPQFWKTHTRHHPSLDDNPRITKTGDGHAGDPLNVSLVGTESEVKEIMQAAEWYAADPLGLRSDLRIGADTILRRSYDEAPVSKLFLFGRQEDLAFEQPVGDNPAHRHHVRFWRTGKVDKDDRPVWIGSASYDKGVGLSHTTGQITHHIAADVDAERDHVLTTLEQTHGLVETYKVRGYHTALEGRNGGGDRWHTDGALWVGIIANKK